MPELLLRGGTVHTLDSDPYDAESFDETDVELTVLDGDVVFDGR